MYNEQVEGIVGATYPNESNSARRHVRVGVCANNNKMEGTNRNVVADLPSFMTLTSCFQKSHVRQKHKGTRVRAPTGDNFLELFIVKALCFVLIFFANPHRASSTSI